MAEEKFSKKRCELMFDYIPDAPYRNYRYYNKPPKIATHDYAVAL
jgi:hypothetical protein